MSVKLLRAVLAVELLQGLHIGYDVICCRGVLMCYVDYSAF